jgi:hypothetical protein
VPPSSRTIQLELAAVDPAAGVDLLEREFHAFLVGLEKAGEHLVASSARRSSRFWENTIPGTDARKQKPELSFLHLAPRSGRMRSVPPGKARQNSLRTRLTIVALLLRP